ncbi:SDR family oxidoreductase [Nocardia sp. NPDC050712]|uniref:SDR family oxidoreductase n=1 Tax=Nocardia sp. NPDC050712 TaxID=3155518 RepID=UPI00341041F6
MVKSEPDSGSWAVITGASSGIGAALAYQLAERGYATVLVARRVDRLEALAGRIRNDFATEVAVIPCDLADRVQREGLCADLASRSVAVLCNNAGFAVCGEIADTDQRAQRSVVQVNVVAVQELTLAVLPGMLARRSGAILITGSISGVQPVPTAATYAASKAFVNSYAEALHVELDGTGVHCTLLSPGPVRTEFYRVGGVSAERENSYAAISTDRVARAGLTALFGARRTVTPGRTAQLQAWGGRTIPRRLLFPALRRLVLPWLRAGLVDSNTRRSANVQYRSAATVARRGSDGGRSLARATTPVGQQHRGHRRAGRSGAGPESAAADDVPAE